jgi:hypothetical protein
MIISMQNIKKTLVFLSFFTSINNVTANEAPECPTPIAATINEIQRIRSESKADRSPFIPQDLDCKYTNPPKHLTLIEASTAISECQAHMHNLNVMKSGCPYYVSEQFNGAGPIWCIQNGAANSKSIELHTMLANVACKE